MNVSYQLPGTQGHVAHPGRDHHHHAQGHGQQPYGGNPGDECVMSNEPHEVDSPAASNWMRAMLRGLAPGDSPMAPPYDSDEDESQDASQDTPRAPAVRRAWSGGGRSDKPFVASWMTAKAKTKNGSAEAESGAPAEDAEAPAEPYIDNIAKFFGGQQAPRKSGGFASRPTMDIPKATGAVKLAKGQRVRHSKYGEGTVLMREGEGEDAKVTVLFTGHGMKKLM